MFNSKMDFSIINLTKASLTELFDGKSKGEIFELIDLVGEETFENDYNMSIKKIIKIALKKIPDPTIKEDDSDDSFFPYL